jgi:hypothetical protein
MKTFIYNFISKSTPKYKIFRPEPSSPYPQFKLLVKKNTKSLPKNSTLVLFLTVVLVSDRPGRFNNGPPDQGRAEKKPDSHSLSQCTPYSLKKRTRDSQGRVGLIW